MYEKAFRKTAINTAVALAGMITASSTAMLEDAALAFTISSISIHVACLATIAAVVWPGWLAYQNGRVVDDPVQKADVTAWARSWWRARTG